MALTIAKRQILRASSANAAAETEVGEWVDVGEYSELYCWLNVTSNSLGAGTLIVTIERQADNTNGYTTLLTFTTVTGSSASSEEKTATSYIGGRIRYRAVQNTANSVTFAVNMYAKYA